MQITQDSYVITKLLNTPGIGPAKIWSIYDYAQKLSVTIDELCSNAANLSAFLKQTQIDAFLSDSETYSEATHKLEANSIKVLSIADSDYPKTIKETFNKKSPPILYLKGNYALLNEQSVSFCGSRKASLKGLEIADDCSYQLTEKNINIVSGYANGIDMAVHRAALQAKGTTTIVLAEGLFNFKIKDEIKDVWDWNRVLLISQFGLHQAWSIHNAMSRNNVICGLGQAMILIEAGITGGSMAAGKTCLEIKRPLFVPCISGYSEAYSGNNLLIKQGAVKFGKDSGSHKAKLSGVLEVLKRSDLIDDKVAQLTV